MLRRYFKNIQYFIQPAQGHYIIPFFRRFFEDCSTAQTTLIAVCSNAGLEQAPQNFRNILTIYFNGIIKRKIKQWLQAITCYPKK
jgi:hypothetical protein